MSIRYSIAVSGTGRSARLALRSAVVDGQLTQHEGRELLGRRPLAQGRPDSRRQLRRREGFDEVVGGAQIEGRGDHIILVVDRQEDDRHFARLQDPPHQRNGGGSGQHQVQEDQLRFDRPHQLERFFRGIG